MIAIFSWPYSTLIQLCFARRGSRAAFALAILFAAGMLAPAQTATTTVSGTVLDPRLTSSALPLPHVLVYATTAPVDPLPTGVQCLTYEAPTGVVSFTYTAFDGTFQLTNVPQGDSYTIVIQAGKWRRQFPNTVVGTTPVTGLALHMPADHTQGDMPLIAVATGNLDGSECVLRDMGIADTEYTDDNGTGGGRIHLYVGTDNGSGIGGGGGGAAINASTPLDLALIQNPTTLANYDVVMLPCHGFPSIRTAAELTNVMNYTNAGGRMFTSDFGYEWLDPGDSYNSPYPPVANWNISEDGGIVPATVTVNTSFNDGETMAEWLQLAGATMTGTNDQLQVSPAYVRLDTVIAPTQSWLTLNSNMFYGQKGNPVMQFTFNTPVGAPAANQCGRVLFNDYHVIPTMAHEMLFPKECPPLPTAANPMKPQEEMLEYALFDLSSFVQPVVTPTISIAFAPNPLTVKSGDVSDEVVVNVTNTSATTAIDSFVTLSFAPPPLVTITGIADTAGGWICTVATLTCTRTTQLAANASDAVTLTLSVGTYSTAPSAGQLTATVSDASFSTNPSAFDVVTYQQQPTITWATPKAIVYGTALSATQLDATASMPGNFTYSPAAGAELAVGPQTLGVTFTPTDTVDYTSATGSVMLTVLPATPLVTVSSNVNPVFMTNAVNFTATFPALPQMPTGTITFMDGGAPIGSATIASGTATFTTSTLTAGSHSITAVYSGDSFFNSATSPAMTENIQDFTLTVGGSSGVNVPGGGTATYTLTVTPVGGTILPAAVNLSASNIPLDATVTFSPNTVAANSPATSVTLELKMPSSASLERPRGLFGNPGIPVALGLILLPFAGRWRKLGRGWRALALLAVTAAMLAVGASGCAGLSPDTFTLNVTAASGSLSHATTLQVTVR